MGPTRTAFDRPRACFSRQKQLAAPELAAVALCRYFLRNLTHAHAAAVQQPDPRHQFFIPLARHQRLAIVSHLLLIRHPAHHLGASALGQPVALGVLISLSCRF
jgi:hypothetical protein